MNDSLGQSSWKRIPISLRAVVEGLVVAAVSGNVWLLLLFSLGAKVGAVAEALFLAVFLWWVHGGGPPGSTRADRSAAFRNTALNPMQWFWGLIAAFSFAVVVHASIVLLFRFVPYPVAAFRSGYDLTFLPTSGLRWVVVMMSAGSAAICEESGFRGFMQQPIEQRHGVTSAVLVSSLFFTALHLTKAWALLGMIPIIFCAGILLGFLAWSSRSLIPGMIGHFIMDVGLFAYWWTGIAGTFDARTINETGVDRPFTIACLVFAVTLVVLVLAMMRLRNITLRILDTDNLPS